MLTPAWLLRVETAVAGTPPMNKNIKIPRVFALLFALFCFAGVSGNANANFSIYICDDGLCTGGGDTIVTDQGVGDNFPGSALVGQVNAGAINVGGFTIVTNVAQSKPLIGSASQPQLDLTFSAVSTDSSPHTVFLYASDTGFTGGNTFSLKLGGTQPPGASGNSITGSAWGGNSNLNLDLSNLLGTTSSLTTSPFASSVGGVFSPGANPFGLTIGVQITRGSAGTTHGRPKFRCDRRGSRCA